MPGIEPTNREKLRRIILLRGMLLVAVGGLLVDAGVNVAGLGAVALVVGFAISNLLLMSTPRRMIGSLKFEHVIGAVDLILVGLGIYLAGAGAGALPISCLLMALVVALGGNKPHTVAGGVAVGALHAWLVLRLAPVDGIGKQLVLQTLFVCAVGLYYATLTERLHRRRDEQSAESLERQEMGALLQILEAVTSTLDQRQVTQAIVRYLSSVVPSVRCSLVHVDRDGTECCVLASHDDPRVNRLPLDLDKYPEIKEAIRTQEPVIIQDAAHHPLMRGVRSYFKHLDFQSIAVIPLTFGNDVLGTLCLKTARTQQSYRPAEIKFITAVARASANALKNSMLHEQVVQESEQRRRTGEKLSRILDHDPDLILTTDGEGRITEFNRGAERLLGYTREEVLGRPCTVLGESTCEQLADRAHHVGVVHSHACSLVKQDGSRIDVELHVSTLGRDEGAVWIGHDVSALKAAQMQLLQAEKLSSIGEVISGVAHELNNPLSGVLGFSQLLMARHGDGPLVKELERINESALRCQKIVKNLLSFSREHKPERKYLGINGIIEKTLDLKKYQLHVTNVEVVTELDKDLPCTMLDFHQMQQVLLNLVNNAQYAIGAVSGRAGRLTVRSREDHGRIRVEITDNGEGMSDDTLTKIFDPFFTTKELGAGTGLGLSVSYGIVREHGGRIYAHSEIDEGTTFVIELPILDQPEEQTRVNDEAGAFAQSGSVPGGETQRRILVVDDEATILDLLMDIIEELGHKVDTASNGNEACRKITASDYDMVITDVRMPQMNGMELYRKILEVKPKMADRIAFITGDLIDPEINGFLAEVNARTLPKPLEIRHVSELVTTTLTE